MFSRSSIGRSAIITASLILTAAVISDTAYAASNVLPATAKAKGYSLTDMAQATAFFNTDWQHRSPETVPDVPFQILYWPVDGNLSFVVKPGTMLYVPILSVDDSPTILGDFPDDPTDRPDVLDYFYNHEEMGFEYVEIVVDGMTTSLDADYVVGVRTAPLPDGGGTGYITVGAVLTPFTKGVHTVKIRAKATGEALEPYDFLWEFEITYTVIVR